MALQRGWPPEPTHPGRHHHSSQTCLCPRREDGPASPLASPCRVAPCVLLKRCVCCLTPSFPCPSWSPPPLLQDHRTLGRLTGPTLLPFGATSPFCHVRLALGPGVSRPRPLPPAPSVAPRCGWTPLRCLQQFSYNLCVARHQLSHLFPSSLSWSYVCENLT